jgi:hypothetical protein
MFMGGYRAANTANEQSGIRPKALGQDFMTTTKVEPTAELVPTQQYNMKKFRLRDKSSSAC